MIKELSRYTAWDGQTGRVRTWVNKVRTAENGVTVIEDLSGWVD